MNASVVWLMPPSGSSGAVSSSATATISLRPPSENPVIAPVPSSKNIVPTALSSSPRCARTYASEPKIPCSSPEKSANRIERLGRSPEFLMARSASITSAALQPSSSAPVPSSQESRCAPNSTHSSGFSLPRSSATTLLVSIGPPILLGTLISTSTFFSACSNLASRCASSRASRICGMRSMRPF